MPAATDRRRPSTAAATPCVAPPLLSRDSQRTPAHLACYFHTDSERSHVTGGALNFLPRPQQPYLGCFTVVADSSHLCCKRACKRGEGKATLIKQPPSELGGQLTGLETRFCDRSPPIADGTGRPCHRALCACPLNALGWRPLCGRRWERSGPAIGVCRSILSCTLPARRTWQVQWQAATQRCGGRGGDTGSAAQRG